MRRLALALAAFFLAGWLAAFGPYDELRALMAPRLPLEEQPADSPAQLQALLQALGESGRAAYRRQLAWDLLLVAANATWLGLWLLTLLRRLLPGPRSRPLALGLTALPCAADLAEDALLAIALRSFPDLPPTLAPLVATATAAKLHLLMLVVAAALLMSLGLGVQRLRARAGARSLGR